MKIKEIAVFSCLVLVLGVGMSHALALKPTSDLDKKVNSVLPTSYEDRWKEIPWRKRLMQGRYDAQKEGKPIFLWLMNGNPFGCT